MPVISMTVSVSHESMININSASSDTFFRVGFLLMLKIGISYVYEMPGVPNLKKHVS